MPIGTVDYISTAPWNDPMNPWPLYSQVSLSAAEISLRTFTLITFDPVADVAAHYTDAAGDYYLDYDATGGQYGNGVSWNVFDDYNSGETLYYKPTFTRAIPAKVVGVADEWQAEDGTDQTTLYIQPVLTSLNPWEHRRRRHLEIC